MGHEARGSRRADSRPDLVYDLEMIEAVLFSEAVREEIEGEDEETRMGGEHPRSEEAAKADDWKTHGQR